VIVLATALTGAAVAAASARGHIYLRASLARR
jgi:hypothetical protein